MDKVIAVPIQRAPTHPGAILRENVLPTLGITIKEAASELRITRQQLHRLLAEQSGISPEMALRLGKFCGNGPTLWIRMQEAFDLWHASQRIGAEVEQIPTRHVA